MKEADIFENWVNSVTESHWSLPETPEQLNRLKELMAKELIVGPDGTNAKEQLRDLIGDDDLFNRIEDLAAQDPRANLWDDTDVQDILQALGIQMPDNSAPDMSAEPQPQQGVAEEFVDQSPDETMDDPDQNDRIANFQKIGQPMDARIGGQRTTTGPDYQERIASVTGPDSRGMHKVTVTQNDDIASNYLTKNPPNNSRFFVSKDANEADNISTFESLQRMRHLSGMPLQESRIEESSEFMYEKIGKTLAQQQPMLDANSDQFVHAVYNEMIELGMTPKSAEHKLSNDQDFLGDVSNSFHHYVRHGTNDMVDENLGGIVGEDQARSERMRRMPAGGFPVADKPMPTAANRAVASLDLSNQQTEPDPLAAMKKSAGLPTIAPRTVKPVDLVKNPELAIDEPQWDYKDSQPAAAATGMSSDTQAQRDRMMRMFAQDQQTQDQRDRIERMRQGMSDTTSDETTEPDVSYTADGIPRIRISAGLEESAPLEECNYTPLNEYCPCHGLKECWLEEMNQSILATGSRLIEDQDEDYGPSGPPGGKVRAMGTKFFKRGPDTPGQYDGKAGYFAHPDFVDATRSADANHLAKTRDSYERAFGPKEPQLIGAQSMPYPPRTPTTRTSTAVAKPVPSAKITATDLPDEPMDEGGMPGMGAALRGAGEMGGKAANAVKSLFKAEPEVGAAIKYPEGHPDFPLLQAARDREQGNMKVWNKRYPDTPWTSQSDADLLKSFNHDLNVEKGFGQFQRDAMPNDYSPTGYTRAQKSKGAAIDAQNSMQGNQDLFKNAYGIDEDMTDVGDVVGQAARSARDYLGKTANNLSDFVGQVQSKTYEPIGNFIKGVKQGYNGKASEKSKGQAHAGQGGYDYSDEEPVAMPVRSPDITTRDLPGDSMDESGRSLNYESREGDALLARIKSLALLR